MLAGGPLADGPLAANPRILIASLVTTSPLVAGGGAISFTAVRRHTIGADLAGGGALQLVTARRHSESPAVIGGAAALAWRWRAQPPVWCAAPLVAVAIGLVVAPAAPRRLRQTGWLLVAASVATAAWLVLAARA